MNRSFYCTFAITDHTCPLRILPLRYKKIKNLPHYTTLQKFSSRINGTLLEKITSSFILLLTNVRKIFTGIDSTGVKITHASQYYTERTGTRRKYAKLSIGADVLQQIICTIR
ncbi:MAG: hypothetical protein WBE68_27435 [Candidatus Nitrosopolaris sp.]